MTETTGRGREELLAELEKVNGQLQTLDADRDAMVKAAREAGASWNQVALALHISKQSAWERYREVAKEGS